MKILVLSEGDPESVHAGSGSVHSIVRALRDAGHTVVTGDAELYGLRRLTAAAVAFSPNRRRWGVKFRTGRIPFAMRSVQAAKALGRTPVDAILQYGSTFSPLVARRDRPAAGPDRGHTRYFMYMDSCMRIAAGSPQSWAGALTPGEVAGVIAREQRAYEKAAAIFTFSEAVRQAFINQVGLPPERVTTTYAGPNLDLSRIPDRSRLPGVDAPPTVLFIGREFERKGGDLLLQAFARVRAKIPGARLVLVGPQALSVAEPGVTNLGLLRKDDPREWAQLIAAYRSADVFCFPTRYEPFGIVILEAMLFGLPCVATRTGAIPEMIKDGETGYLVPPEDVDTLTARLLTLLGDRTLSMSLG
ncbi:MAG TPA: glycosyltransferase family 4 protein, partial [Myxococcaceae bacterium]